MKSKWRECTIGDLCNSISETYKRNDDEVILINTSDILDGSILNHTPVPNNILKGQFKKTFKKKDILYSEIRPANKRYAFIDIDNTDRYIASTKLMVLRSRTDIILPEFLFAILKSKNVVDELQYLAETRSGTFPQITFLSELAPMEVRVPDIPTQKRIVSVLKAIEDKIKINTAINENLEQQAQGIFSNLFPNCMSNGIAMSSIIDVRDGTHDSPKAKEKGYYLITSKHLQAYSVNKKEANLISYEDFKKINERSKVEHGDILISMIGTVGLISFISDEKIDFAIKNVGLFRTSQNLKLRFYLLNYLKTNEVINYIEQHLAGSTQKYISLTELRNLPIHIPSDENLHEYNNLVSPIFGTIIDLYQENQRLANLCDTLLPKLMNGEIDVSQVQNKFR